MNEHLRHSHKSSRGQQATKAYSSQGLPPDYQQIRESDNYDERARERRQTGRFLDSSSDLENRLKSANVRNQELEDVVANKEE